MKTRFPESKLTFKKSFIFIFAFLIIAGNLQASSEYYGEPKLGVQPISSDRYGASYYAPAGYTPDKDWPLVVVLFSDEAQKGTLAVETWLSEVKKHNVIALFVSYLEPRESPFGSDARMFALIRQMKNIFRIDDSRILLVGFGDAAHYSYYVAHRYPEQFSANALVNGDIEGRFDTFIHLKDESGKSIRYLVVYGDKDATIKPEKLMSNHTSLEALGYQIEVAQLNGFDHKLYPEMSDKVLNWFDQVPPRVKMLNGEGKPSSRVIDYARSVVSGLFKN